MILAATVDFETSKLLRDKEFENTTPHRLYRSYYNHLGEYRGDVSEYIRARVGGLDTKPFESVDAPTIGQVVDWLYEKHGIWVTVDFNSKVWYQIINIDNNRIIQGFHPSPKVSYEAAINHCLTKLI